MLVAFFSFLISLVAQLDRVLVLLVLDLLPAVNKSEIGSTSRRVTISLPKAAQRSPISPALAATLASECSLSRATSVMKLTIWATCGCTIARSAEGFCASPFNPVIELMISDSVSEKKKHADFRKIRFYLVLCQCKPQDNPLSVHLGSRAYRSLTCQPCNNLPAAVSAAHDSDIW